MQDVVIIGGGIAGLATAYRLRQSAARCHLIEAAPRCGGKIVTESTEGFVIEGGPDAIVPHKPSGVELIRELGLGDRLLASNDDRRGTFVLHEGQLQPLPEGLQMLAPANWGSFLRSPLLSWPAKLRFALEGRVPPRREESDESVADFVRRRLGEGALWSLAEPMLAHIHVANIERMSLRATYPHLAAMEGRHGSLRQAAKAMRGQQKDAGERPKNPVFWSLKGGFGELVEALRERLDPSTTHLGRKARELRARTEGGYVVTLDDGTEIAADAVVLATPAPAAGDVLAELDAALADKLRAIRYVSMATLSLAYRRDEISHPLDGFGFFVPRRERRQVLACTWSSIKFDHRAPREHALLRVFLGGAGGEDFLDLPDDDLVATVRDELGSILGFSAEPRLARLFRWPQGYPQYDVGHVERVAAIEAALPPGLALAGSAFHGVGIPDCVKSGFAAADRIFARKIGA